MCLTSKIWARFIAALRILILSLAPHTNRVANTHLTCCRPNSLRLSFHSLPFIPNKFYFISTLCRLLLDKCRFFVFFSLVLLLPFRFRFNCYFFRLPQPFRVKEGVRRDSLHFSHSFLINFVPNAQPNSTKPKIALKTEIYHNVIKCRTILTRNNNNNENELSVKRETWKKL